MHQIYYLATSEKSYSKGYGVEPHRVLCGYMLVKLKKQGGRYTEWLQPVLVAPVSKPKPKTETSQGREIKTRGHQSQTANLTFPNDRLLKSRPSGHLLPLLPLLSTKLFPSVCQWTAPNNALFDAAQFNGFMLK